MSEHYHKLEQMYLSAPVNHIYKVAICIEKDGAEISWEVNSDFFHAARSLHGSVYFKLLDDAAYFAAASCVTDVFILTSNFSINLIRPVVGGKLTAKGSIISKSRQLIIARAELFNEKGKLVAEGTGNFMRGSTPLTPELGYKSS